MGLVGFWKKEVTMRDFKFFRGAEFNVRGHWDAQRQVYEPLRITQVEQMERERTINDAIRHEEYLHNLHSTHSHRYETTESVVDWGRMAREIREQAQLREMVNRTTQQPNEYLHRGRRTRYPY